MIRKFRKSLTRKPILTHKSTLSWVLVSVSFVLLASCGSPPKRDPYPGADQVTTTVNPALLVGTWEARVLNPTKDEPAMTSIVSLEADNTFLMKTELLPTNESEPGMNMDYSGNWSVSDGALRYTNIKVLKSEATKPAEFADDPQSQALWLEASSGIMSFAASAATSFMNSRSSETNSSNILELDGARMVLLGQAASGSNPIAYEYSRTR